MESVAAWGHPRGCYDVEWTWPGVTRQRLWNVSPLGGARGDVML